MAVPEYPYYFVHWIDLQRDHYRHHAHERFGTFPLEIMEVPTDASVSVAGLPIPMTEKSLFKVSKFRRAKSTKTVGMVYAIDDVLVNPLRISGDKDFTMVSVEDILSTGETEVESKHLNGLEYCQAVIVYISAIEVEYIHFMLRHPFSLGDVLKLYRRSQLGIVKQSLLYHVMEMFDRHNLPLPLVFCVRSKTELSSHQTSVGTRDSDDDFDSDLSSGRCSCLTESFD